MTALSATKHEHGERSAFRNTTTGWVGAIQYAPNGDEKSIAVEPNGVVWLSEAEQELTAKSHKAAASNPFLPQPYEVRDPHTDEVTESGHRPVFVADDEERPIPGVSRDLRPEARRALAHGEGDGDGDAPDGSRDEREEVDTPAAEAPPARRRRRAPAAS